MHDSRQKSARDKTGERAGIWLALAIAIGLHVIVLILPIARYKPAGEKPGPSIELQLTTVYPQASPPPADQPDPVVAPPEPVTETTDELPDVAPEEPTEPIVDPATDEPQATERLVERETQRDLDSLSDPEKSQLTSTILARQFFTEESAVDQLFGKPLQQPDTELFKGFHYPLRPDLISMLDQPVPDLPFAYTPGLVYFAYEPGVKGDLQRFWDVITPEFGWRTKYGTEVRCVLVLVLVGCGWK